VSRRSAEENDGPAGDPEAIHVRLDELLAARGMTLTELSAQVDVTIVNLSVLKNGRARAIRFSTMARLCEVLQCQPGDLLSYRPVPVPAPSASASRPAR
jgi:putative transcriptional regulator